MLPEHHQGELYSHTPRSPKQPCSRTWHLGIVRNVGLKGIRFISFVKKLIAVVHLQQRINWMHIIVSMSNQRKWTFFLHIISCCHVFNISCGLLFFHWLCKYPNHLQKSALKKHHSSDPFENQTLGSFYWVRKWDESLARVTGSHHKLLGRFYKVSGNSIRTVVWKIVWHDQRELL